MAMRDVPCSELSKSWPYLTREQLQEFKDAFRVFDKDGQGTISSKELRVVFSSLGQRPTKVELEKLVKSIDVNGDGEIDFPEFLIMMLTNTDEDMTEKGLLDVFAAFDKDNSGTISQSELSAAVKVIDGKLTAKEIQTIIMLADRSGDGEVDYNEFIQFVLSDELPDRRKVLENLEM